MQISTGIETNLLCPTCGRKGRSVKPVTIESLVSEAARASASRTGGFRFCSTPSCEVAYFHPDTGERFMRCDLTVRVGLKETTPPRPVCYCFGHTVEEIESEVVRTATSRILDEISEKCRKGLDRCEETNPQGACCLGNVRRAVKEAQVKAGVFASSAPDVGASSPPEENCCGHASSRRTSRVSPVRAAGLAPAGAILSAILASACCWLPLLLLAIGVSAAGAGRLFAVVRPYFLTGAAVFLAIGFYVTYVRRRACGADECCAAENLKLRRFNRIMLWVAVIVVLAIASLPSYVGAMIGGDSHGLRSATEPGPPGHEYVFAIEGMHCEACATTLSAELAGIGGVRQVRVDYATKRARVAASGDAVIPRIRDSAARLGYSAVPRSGAP